MNKEPIALYIFRFVLGFALFAFMAMLYWSSLLVEEKLKGMQTDLKTIKHELNELRRDPNVYGVHTLTDKKDLPNLSLNNPSLSLASSTTSVTPSSSNLLSPDPFYTEVLPKLLGPHFKPHGIRKEDSIGKPDNLNPFSQWYEVASWNRMCTATLLTQEVGKYETYCPGIAMTMELKYTPEGSPEYWMHLRQDTFWQPLNPLHFSNQVELAPWFLKKHQVTAHDFKFYFDALMNRHVEQELAVTLRTLLSDIEEVRVENDFILAVRWKTKKKIDAEGKEIQQMKYLAKSLTGSLSPLPRFVYQYFPDGSKIVEDDSDPNTYRTNPVWAQNFNRHWAQNVIVSCGAWMFDGMSDREIKFKRNSDYYNPLAVLTEAYEIKFRDSLDAMWNDFKTGMIDLVNVRPNQLNELQLFLQSVPYQNQLKQGLGINKITYLARRYSYVAWNEKRALFTNKKVRQALTMAVDRERIIRQNLNGMGVPITGTFFPYSPSYDKNIKPYPFDVDQARKLLREEGWSDERGSGVIEKMIGNERIPFSFTLTYFVKDPTMKAICEFIATSLKEVGIECKPNGVDIADLSAVFENKDFDALCMHWTLGTPPEDPKQLWYSTDAQEKGSSNFISFSNKEVDSIIEELEYEDNLQKRVELYHRFDRILYEEAPYIFLFTPKATMVYRDYLQNVLIPAERPDLFPDGNVGEPDPSLYWIKREE